MPVFSTLDPFFSSKFSIQWAKDHINEFEARAEKFFQEDSCTIFTEPDIDPSYQLLKIKANPILPRSLLGHATDTVYNLRAALDQAISSTATLNGTPSEYCFFPIYNAEKYVEDALEGSKRLKNLIPQEIANLVRAFKPYKGGNDLVWALNKLCNTSKHGILYATPATVNFSVSAPTTGGTPETFTPPLYDSDKCEMTFARLPIVTEHTVNSDIAFTIGFSNIEYIDNRPALLVLKEFVDIVEGIVMAIESESRRIGIIIES